ncbi:hypothetical protein THAOC_34776 [Thalassiosira oceanica]|uniref:Uncharacterized protein n=1 Tax=Thalassiosira oceanica TaxID=159749 RepID=K0RIN8_THAOC|nr:hypothetical protein THAOC_34776 [Thalassiosira oceanica]|mmetsp:Transcript_20885/g.49087  ORF Transcript_20885/g.49087 Transcript_20885/m.49087 type:complete len:168 (+) Transcript_20885:132-635(+)|eukprot:EJK46552.1 hypothetical protein THAOC_34776 [Thalassiosira oceanica]
MDDKILSASDLASLAACSDTATETSDSDTADEERSDSSPSVISASRKKSVRFSIVKTREFYLVDDNENDVGHSATSTATSRTSLGWDVVSESQCDVNQHEDVCRRSRAEKYDRMIQVHIQKKEKREEQRQLLLKKKRGIGARVLGQIWRGVVEMGKASAHSMPVPRI